MWTLKRNTRNCQEGTEWDKQAEEEGDCRREEMDQITNPLQEGSTGRQLHPPLPQNAEVWHEGSLWNSRQIPHYASPTSDLVSKPRLQGKKILSLFFSLNGKSLFLMEFPPFLILGNLIHTIKLTFRIQLSRTSLTRDTSSCYLSVTSTGGGSSSPRPPPSTPASTLWATSWGPTWWPSRPCSMTRRTRSGASPTSSTRRTWAGATSPSGRRARCPRRSAAVRGRYPWDTRTSTSSTCPGPWASSSSSPRVSSATRFGTDSRLIQTWSIFRRAWRPQSCPPSTVALCPPRIASPAGRRSWRRAAPPWWSWTSWRWSTGPWSASTMEWSGRSHVMTAARKWVRSLSSTDSWSWVLPCHESLHYMYMRGTSDHGLCCVNAGVGCKRNQFGTYSHNNRLLYLLLVSWIAPLFRPDLVSSPRAMSRGHHLYITNVSGPGYGRKYEETRVAEWAVTIKVTVSVVPGILGKSRVQV